MSTSALKGCCRADAGVSAVSLRALIVGALLEANALEPWRSGNGLHDAVFETAAVFPLPHGLAFDAGDFIGNQEPNRAIDNSFGFRYNGIRSMQEDFSPFLPLSPAILHILLALASEDRHGYGIMQEVRRQSGGSYNLGPGTLYDNLQKLMDQGIVEETSTRSKNDDPRRRYYRLNRFGAGLLTAEISRLEILFRQAKSHLRRAVS